MLSTYYIIATLPVNYYEQPPACVPVDYTINYSSLHVLINNLGIVWPPCGIGKNHRGMGPNTIIMLVKPFPRRQKDYEWVLAKLKHQRRIN